MEKSTQQQLTGGQLIVKALETHGTKRVFCVPGESYLPVLDALYDSPIDTIVCRHEGGACMMAEATGKLDGQPGICFVTRGPGSANACAGLHVALQDSTPLILFIGQIGVHVREREAFQEVDYRRFLGSTVKWVAEIDHADRIEEFVSRAFHTATSGRPGPVALALPETTLAELALSKQASAWQQVESWPGNTDMQQLARLLHKAEQPLAIVGGSRWDAAAVESFEQLAQQWQLPVACSFRRQMLFDHQHPNYAGDVGIGLNPELRSYISSSDLILLIGGRLSEISSQDYALLESPFPQQTLVHVYPGAEELGRVYQPAIAIQASPKGFIEAWKNIPAPAEMNETRKAQVRQCHESYSNWSGADAPTPGNVQMREVINTLQTLLPDDAIITNGAGNYASWIHRFWKFRHYGSQLAPTSGSMGYGLPAAIAAGLHQPQRRVIAFAGDGCLQMTMQEIGTAMQYGVRVIIIVIDNGIYGTIRMHQERHFPGRISGTDLINPDFAAIAVAYGAQGFTVEQTGEFHAAISAALDADTASLIHIKTSAEAITPSTTLSAIRKHATKK